MARALQLSMIALAALLALAGGPRAASTCESAPGTSGLDQYCETIPGAGGGSPSVGGSDADRLAGERALPPAAARSLAEPGEVNAGIRALVGAGPARDRRPPSPPRRPAKKDAGAPVAESSGGPLGAVANSVKDGPTVSPSLPLILLIVAILAASIAWLRTRSHDRSP